VLAGGLTLQSKMVPNGHVSHREWLFEAIKKILESDRTAHGRHAQECFDEEVDARSEPDPDRAYEERRDHQAMGWL
jgi:hypothetical protein